LPVIPKESSWRFWRKHRIPVFDYPAEEWEKDSENGEIIIGNEFDITIEMLLS